MLGRRSVTVQLDKKSTFLDKIKLNIDRTADVDKIVEEHSDDDSSNSVESEVIIN